MLVLLWVALCPAFALRVSTTRCPPHEGIEPQTRAILEAQVDRTVLCWWGQGSSSWWARGTTAELNDLITRLSKLYFGGLDVVRLAVVLHRGRPDLARWGDAIAGPAPNWRLDFRPRHLHGEPKGRLASVAVHVWLGGEINAEELVIVTDRVIAQRTLVAVGREDVKAAIGWLVKSQRPELDRRPRTATP